MNFRRIASATVGMLVFTICVRSAEIPKAPVPPSPFLKVVYSYADALLKHGRDQFGEKHTGLFLSALDRTTLQPLRECPPPPAGLDPAIRGGRPDGPLAGSNPQHDQNLLRLLETLSGLSSNAAYREAAEAELKWMLTDPASTGVEFSPWRENRSWDALNDTLIRSAAPGVAARPFRPWMLWDRCFDLAPEASRSAVLRWTWADSPTDKSVAANSSVSGKSRGRPFDPEREAGISLRTWAVAFARTGDAEFRRRIEQCLDRLREPAAPTNSASLLSLAIDCDGAAHRVPEPLASRLRSVARRADSAFLSQAHDLKKSGGFTIRIDPESSGEVTATPLWTCRSDTLTTAQLGMMCVSRCDNIGAPAFRDLMLAAADAYRVRMPGNDDDTWPLAFGHTISLQVAAWRHTANRVYLDRARSLADFAMVNFFGNSPLPKASLKSSHYESATGADTLALALIELHLNILAITAVRCPPNTIDR